MAVRLEQGCQKNGFIITSNKTYPNEYCVALNNKEAVDGIDGKNGDIVYCVNNPCLHGYKDRQTEKHIDNPNTVYICPSPTGLIEEVVTGIPKHKGTFLW